jgi:hypothetical protein
VGDRKETTDIVKSLEIALRAPPNPEFVRRERAATADALIEIVKGAMSEGGNKDLVSKGTAALSEYGDCERVPRFLVGIIDYRDSPAASNNPMSQYPAAMALLKVGIPARLSLLSVAKPLTADALQLRSFVSAHHSQS